MTGFASVTTHCSAMPYEVCYRALVNAMGA